MTKVAPMDENTQFTQRFELLKMARDLLVEEYLNLRAEQHNAWIVADNKMWEAYKMNMPYPKFVAYPTEENILKKARALYTFLSERPIDAVDTMIIKDEHAADSIVDQLPEILSDIFPEIPSDEEKDDVTADITTLLPGWVRRARA